MNKKLFSLSDFPAEILIEICLFVDTDSLNNFNFTLFHKFGLTTITSKSIQEYFTTNCVFIEFRIHKIDPVYALNMFRNIFRKNLSTNFNYFKLLLTNKSSSFTTTLNDIIRTENICRNKYAKILNLLIKDKRISSSISEFKSWSIGYASEHGETKIVKILLQDKRLDPSDYRNYAINHASENGHFEIVKLLLQDTRVCPNFYINYPIRFASENGHIEVVKLLLQDKRVDPSDHYNYAINNAAKNGYYDIVKLLLTDTRVSCSDLTSATSNALNNNYIEIVELIQNINK